MPREDVEGLAALDKLLRELPERLQKSVIAGAMKAGADSMLAPLQAAAPVFTGRLEESLVSVRESASRTRRRGVQEVASGVTFKSPGRRYWHFLEFGTSKLPARPWIRPTFVANVKAAEAAIREYAGKRIEREAKKLGGKGG